jgi:hypothetical protein
MLDLADHLAEHDGRRCPLCSRGDFSGAVGCVRVICRVPPAQAIRYGAVGVVFVGLAIASAQGRRRRQIDRGSDEVAALRAYSLPVIVPQALREALSFIGIKAGLMTGSESWILIFATASLTSQFIGRPKMGDLEAMVRSASADQAD